MTRQQKKPGAHSHGMVLTYFFKKYSDLRHQDA